MAFNPKTLLKGKAAKKAAAENTQQDSAASAAAGASKAPKRTLKAKLSSFRLGDLSIVSRLYLGFGFFLLVYVCLALYTLYMIHEHLESDQYYLNETHKVHASFDEAADLLYETERIMSSYASNAQPEDRQALLEASAADIRTMPALLQESANGIIDPQLRTHIKGEVIPELKRHFDECADTLSKVQTAIRSGGIYSRDDVHITVQTVFLPASELIKEALVKISDSYMLLGRNENVFEQARILSLAVLGGSFILFVIGLVAFTGSLRNDLGRVRSMLKSLAHGVLAPTERRHSRNEIGSMEYLVDEVSKSMGATMGKVKNDVVRLKEALNNTSELLEAASENISVQRTRAQSVAEATSTMDSSIQKVTEFARSTLTEVKSAETASDTCRMTMQDNITTTHTLSDRLRETSQAVLSINEMGAQINDIVNTIEAIADQTNLLALNASIEAARSGEYGRGFAVVAEEIRDLASKTAKSTKEVTSTIQNLSLAVDKSVKVVASCESEMSNSLQQSSRANSAIEEIMGIIATITDMSEQIVDSCQMQAEQTSEVTKAIANINNITEGTFDNINEMLGSTRELLSLTQEQEQILSRFTTSQSQAG